MQKFALNFKSVLRLKTYCTASFQQRYKLVVVGGGSAGISMAARLSRRMSPYDILIIEPSEIHYYQPGFTMVAAGLKEFDRTIWRRTEELIPEKCKWIQDKVVAFEPEQNKLILKNCKDIYYEFLIVAIGVTLDHTFVPNMWQALFEPLSGVCSMYNPDLVRQVFPNIQAVKEGNAIFTSPRSKIKCPSAPIKITLLAEDYFQRAGIRKKVDVMYFTAASNLYSIPYYSEALEKLFEKRKISIHTNFELIKLDNKNKLARFSECSAEHPLKELELEYTFLHFTPHQYAPLELQMSRLANEHSGYLDVDKLKLRHRKYANVYGLGDCLNIPTCKTLAATIQQMETVYNELLKDMNLRKKSRSRLYDGYTACPIITSRRKMMLSEFNYFRERTETFPFNQRKERRSLFLLLFYIFPFLYWNYIIRGRWMFLNKIHDTFKYLNKKFK